MRLTNMRWHNRNGRRRIQAARAAVTSFDDSDPFQLGLEILESIYLAKELIGMIHQCLIKSNIGQHNLNSPLVIQIIFGFINGQEFFGFGFVVLEHFQVSHKLQQSGGVILPNSLFFSIIFQTIFKLLGELINLFLLFIKLSVFLCNLKILADYNGAEILDHFARFFDAFQNKALLARFDQFFNFMVIMLLVEFDRFNFV